MLIMLPVIHYKDYTVIHRTDLTGLRESDLRFAQFMKDRVTNWL